MVLKKSPMGKCKTAFRMKDPLPWNAKSDPRGEGLEVLGNLEGTLVGRLRGLQGLRLYVVLGKADIVFYVQTLSS